MKSFKNIIFVLCLMVMATVNYAGNITAVNNNGDWSTPSTWNLNRIPKTGDTVNIPAGKTVQVSSNVYHSVPQYALLQIRVYGVLEFIATGQLNLKCLSSVCVFGSGIIPSTGCNCNQIGMGTGEAPWKGAYASISGGSCVSSPCAALPVTLVSFDAVGESETVKLSWVAAGEVNLDHYEVERSADGINFESIGNANSSGSLLFQNYYFTDLLPLGLLSYYRLKTVDLDKSIRYSKMIAVKSSEETALEIYPNPVTGNNFNVLVPAVSASEEITVTIKDLMGKEYSTLTYSFKEAFPIPASSLLPGIYVVIVNVGSQTSSVRVVVQ